MSSTAATTPPPETIPGDRFVLLEKIGEGGNAVVWRAQDRELRVKVAIKILRSTDPDIQARFAQEVLVLASLHHANVVRALARGFTSRGAPYVVLELVTGQSLRTRLETGGPLPWREVVGIGVQLAGALSALNADGIVHRDVKPDNIMLTPDGHGGQVVKLIDFGVARLTEAWDVDACETPAPRPRTKLGLVVGTPGYMPPEAGYEPPCERYDVYGLAATLWELATGERAGPSPQAGAACELPEDLCRVLVAALAVDPDDRTQSAAELGRGLEAVHVAHPEREPSALFDGRYERIAVLGTGARADAFFACHRGSRHEVVLKLLRARAPDDARRFVREADLLAHLDHPGIPRFYDFAPEASPPYIAMSRAPGVPAVRLCPPEAPRMKFVEIAQVGIRLAEILEHLHARGVLHRDINANNVIIDLRREPQVTLIDFGSAALTEKYYSLASPPRYWTPPETRVDIPDGGLEKLPWSAPEARSEGFSAKSDVYSLGFLLYRLITGKRPIQGDDARVHLHKHHPRCPPDIAQAVLGALNPDPRSRLDAAQLAERLRDALPEDGTAPSDAAPVALPAPPRKPDPWDRSTRGWTQFMSATAEPPGTATANARPSGAVAANAEAPPGAKVIPLHPRDILDRATSLDPDFLPTPSDPRQQAEIVAPPASAESPQERSPVWARYLAAATLGGLMTLGLAQLLAPRSSDLEAMNLASVADADDVEPPPPVPTAIEEPRAADLTVSLPRMREALTDVHATLRGCAARTGKLLMVEFTTQTGGDHFASVVVSGLADPHLTSCVREATAKIRFQPEAAQTFTEEYEP